MDLATLLTERDRKAAQAAYVRGVHLLRGTDPDRDPSLVFDELEVKRLAGEVARLQQSIATEV